MRNKWNLKGGPKFKENENISNCSVIRKVNNRRPLIMNFFGTADVVGCLLHRHTCMQHPLRACFCLVYSRFWQWESALESFNSGPLPLASVLLCLLFPSLFWLPHTPSFLLVPLSHFLLFSLSTNWWFIKAHSPLMISYGVVVWKATWVFLTSFRKSSSLSSPKVSTLLRWIECCWFCTSIPGYWSI